MTVTHLIRALTPTSNQLDDCIPDPRTWCGQSFVARSPWPDRDTHLFVFEADFADCTKCLEERRAAILAKGSTID